MDNCDILSRNLIIVGYRHGDFAEVLSPYFNGECSDEETMKKELNGGDVILTPEANRYDANAVIVHCAKSLKTIGHLWTGQAAAMRHWMEEHNKCYVRAHVTRLNKHAGALIALCEQEIRLDFQEPYNANIDMRWASNIPEVLLSLNDQSLSLGIMLLRDELKHTESWSDVLQVRIDNILSCLPIDLSAHRFKECVEVYNMMATSNIKEVRVMSEILLGMYIKRGSADQIDWWVRNWLKDYYRWAADGDVIAIYQAAGYTQGRVKEILEKAPCNLFYLYQANKFRFAKHLLYSFLPQDVYNRLLTLLAVWELMRGEQTQIVEVMPVEKKVVKKERICSAIKQLHAEGELKHKYDYTWLMTVMIEQEGLPGFKTPAAFIEYLKSLNLGFDLPSRTTVSRYCDRARGCYPNWSFIDANDLETIRRNNVAKRFLKLLKL